jgi:hypothetical protein
VDSSLSFERKRPIRFTPELARKLEELHHNFRKANYEQDIVQNGLSISEFPNMSALEEAYNSNDNRISYSIYSSINKSDRCAWSVVLADDTRIDSLDLSQLLDLPNIGKVAIIKVSLYGGSHRSLTIKFNNNLYIGSSEVQMNSSFDILKKFRSEIETLFDLYQQPWWPIRDGRVIFLIWAAPATLGNVWTIFDGFRGSKNPFVIDGWWVLIPILCVISVFIVPVVKSVAYSWNWAFPMVDFSFGGGVQSSEVKKNVRRALWIVPITMIIIPYVVNHLK